VRVSIRISRLFALALVAGSSSLAFADRAADRVVILANSDDPDSVPIAEHYADVRGVPRKNLISLRMPVEETITWGQFVSQIWQPLEDELVRRGWVDAIPMDLVDLVGRRKYAIYGHHISALVVCRGVPLRISHDPSRFTEFKPITNRSEFRTNEGAVDSELSLLARTDYPINGFIPNPLYGKASVSDYVRQSVVLVGRLDGPTAADAFGLVDRAVLAETNGLLGRAYVDLGGPHPEGDAWLTTVSARIKELGFDQSVDREPALFPGTARFDAPVLYFGWYSNNIEGPFKLPGFFFPPGAIALHIHSFSARSMRLTDQAWTAPFVAHGVTATVGNVWEPYLQLTHRPDLLLEALSRGEMLGEAAYYALPALSWQGILVGDPLYRPFAVPLSAQLGRLKDLPPRLAGYAIARRMNLFDSAGLPEAAVRLGRTGMKSVPSLGLALCLAPRLAAAGHVDEAAKDLLAAAALPASAGADQWGLLHAAAEFLLAQNRPAAALEAYRRLLAVEALPPSVRASWLLDGQKAAVAAGDGAQASAWKAAIPATVDRILSGH